MRRALSCDVVRLTLGSRGAASLDVDQRFIVLGGEQAKRQWLLLHLTPLAANGKVGGEWGSGERLSAGAVLMATLD